MALRPLPLKKEIFGKKVHFFFSELDREKRKNDNLFLLFFVKR
jgi:hypothetical protein